MRISLFLEEISFWNFWRHSWAVSQLIPNNTEFLVCLSVCYLLLPYWNQTKMGIPLLLDEISFWNFLRHSWDIGSLVFTLFGWAYILTFEFLCAGLKFETSDLFTFWLSGGQLLRPSGLVNWYLFLDKTLELWLRVALEVCYVPWF